MTHKHTAAYYLPTCGNKINALYCMVYVFLIENLVNDIMNGLVVRDTRRLVAPWARSWPQDAVHIHYGARGLMLHRL